MNFTKKAIVEAFWKLLEEKPYNKITVKEIVDSCQVNRNTFYYHFHDIPDLLEQIIKKDADDIIQTNTNFGSPMDCLTPLVQYCLNHQKAILHIYNSVHREVFLNEFNKLGLYLVTQYIDTVTAELTLQPTDKELLIRLYKCVLVGIFLDWLNEGMNYDLLASMLFSVFFPELFRNRFPVFCIFITFCTKMFHCFR